MSPKPHTACGASGFTEGNCGEIRPARCPSADEHLLRNAHNTQPALATAAYAAMQQEVCQALRRDVRERVSHWQQNLIQIELDASNCYLDEVKFKLYVSNKCLLCVTLCKFFTRSLSHLKTYPI